MAGLSLKLADGSVLTGKTYLKLNKAFELSSASVPRAHLDSWRCFTCDYFDLDAKHTVRQFSELLGVPAIAFNRPGYGGTPTLRGVGTGASETLIQCHGRWINELALPAIWKEFSHSLNVSSTVLYGEPIGGAVCTMAAGLHAKDGAPYKLAGLMLSAIGSARKAEPLKPFFEDVSMRGKPLSLPKEATAALALKLTVT